MNCCNGGAPVLCQSDVQEVTLYQITAEYTRFLTVEESAVLGKHFVDADDAFAAAVQSGRMSVRPVPALKVNGHYFAKNSAIKGVQ